MGEKERRGRFRDWAMDSLLGMTVEILGVLVLTGAGFALAFLLARWH
ncbi:MAG: hypothetical protein ACM3ZC_16970 [Bacteroidota bacterium]